MDGNRYEWPKHLTIPGGPLPTPGDVEEWPVESERVFTDGDVECACGRKFHLWWNGGELDEHMCACGRFYRTEHVEVHLVVRRRRSTWKCISWCDGVRTTRTRHDEKPPTWPGEARSGAV